MPGQTGTSEEPQAERTLRTVRRGVEEAVGNGDPNGRRATVVMGERKAASRGRLRTGEASGGPRQSRPVVSKRCSGEHNEVISRFSCAAALSAKRAG
jgi:hypothetical protein